MFKNIRYSKLISALLSTFVGTTIWVGGTSSLLFPESAQAGLFADLNSVVMSNATTPKTLKTGDRSALFGGAVDMRVPVTSINVVTFNPPSFDAGCGGISLSGGAFSFISLDQIVKTFKNIATNSEGLAFKAAIDAISPNLGKLMQEFQTLLQKMNNAFKNTCSVANSFVTGSGHIMTNAVSGDGAIGALNTQYSDMSADLDSYTANPVAYMDKVSPNMPSAGNINLKQIAASGATTNLAGSGLSNADGSSDDPTDPNALNTKVLLSFLGFTMSAVNCSLTDLNGNVQTTSKVGLGGTFTCTAASSLKLNDLIEGGGSGSPQPNAPLTLWQCKNPDGSVTGGSESQPCTQMQQIHWNYSGFRGYTNTMMFGSPDEASLNTGNISPTSIMGVINATSTNTVATLSSAQIQFLNKFALKPALLFKSADPGVRLDLGVKLSRLVSSCMASKVGAALWKSANSMKTGNNYEPTKEFDAKVAELNLDYKAQKSLCDNSKAKEEYIQLLASKAQLTSNRK